MRDETDDNTGESIFQCQSASWATSSFIHSLKREKKEQASLKPVQTTQNDVTIHFESEPESPLTLYIHHHQLARMLMTLERLIDVPWAFCILSQSRADFTLCFQAVNQSVSQPPSLFLSEKNKHQQEAEASSSPSHHPKLLDAVFIIYFNLKLEENGFGNNGWRRRRLSSIYKDLNQQNLMFFYLIIITNKTLALMNKWQDKSWLDFDDADDLIEICC